MPLYDYHCTSCGYSFEALIRPGEERSRRCPACGSLNVDRLVSEFAVSSDTTRQANLAKAKAENRPLHRDKMMAEWEDEQAHRH